MCLQFSSHFINNDLNKYRQETKQSTKQTANVVSKKAHKQEIRKLVARKLKIVQFTQSGKESKCTSSIHLGKLEEVEAGGESSGTCSTEATLPSSTDTGGLWRR